MTSLLDSWGPLPESKPEFPTRRETFIDIEIIGGATVGGDIISSNWDGARPPSLTTIDSAATTGYVLDGSLGAAQVTGSLWVGDAANSIEINASSTPGRLEWTSTFSGNTPDGKALLFASLTSDAINEAALQLWGFGYTGRDTPIVELLNDADVAGYRYVRSGTAGTEELFVGETPLGDGVWVAASQLFAPAGTAAAPGVAIGQVDDGIYSSADGHIDITIAETQEYTFDATSLDMQGNDLLDVGNIRGAAWADFTPTWGAGFTLGNGTVNHARWVQIGKTVICQVKVTLGSTSSVSGSWTMELPTTAATTPGNHNIYGWTHYFDSGTANYGGRARLSSTSAVTFTVNIVSGTYMTFGTLSSTVPFTWTTSDVLAATCIFEAA